MDKNRTERVFSVGGMTCAGCELRIENGLKKLPGVEMVRASLKEAAVHVIYDGETVTSKQIENAVAGLGYEVRRGAQEGAARNASGAQTPSDRVLGVIVAVFALYMLMRHTIGFDFIPDINENMSLGLLFTAGLVTSVHCLAMCGGINLSQNLGAKQDGVKERLTPGFLYNLGRVISYTAVGALAGALGSVVGFSGAARGVVAMAAGVLMVVIGLRLLGVFPGLQSFGITLPKILGQKLYAGKSRRGPFFVGLLNGLMPCGPLQTMQLYALGTGNALKGALSMLVFCLGTVPLMFLFGAVSSFLSGKFTRGMMKAGAVVVMVLGLAMVSRGLGLSGIQLGAPSGGGQNVAVVENGVQTVTTSFSSGRYAPITVRRGVPVRWTVRVTEKDLNGCNNPFVIPKYGIEKKLVPGDNIVEFTPGEAGTIPYSCWMGMIRSTITVTDDVSAPSG